MNIREFITASVFFAAILFASQANATCSYGGTYPDCKDKPKDPPPVVDPQPDPTPEPEPTPTVDPAPEPAPEPVVTDKKTTTITNERKDYTPRMRQHCPEPKKSSLITDQSYAADKFDIAPAERCCVRAYSWREAKKVCEKRG